MQVNLKHNFPLLISVVVVSLSLPLFLFVTFTQQQDLRSKAYQPPVTYYNKIARLKVTEFGTVLSKILESTPPAKTVNSFGGVPGRNRYFLQTDDGRIYPLTQDIYPPCEPKNPCIDRLPVDLSKFLGKKVFAEGIMTQYYQQKCTLDAPPLCAFPQIKWWPLPNNLQFAVAKIQNATLWESNFKGKGTIIDAKNVFQGENVFLLTPSTINCTKEPCLKMPQRAEMYVRSSFEDLSEKINSVFFGNGKLYGLNNGTRILDSLLSQITVTPQPSIVPVNQAALFFNPNVFQTQVGQNIGTSLVINTNGLKISGLNLTLAFDPNKIKVAGVTPQYLFPNVLVQPKIDNNAGTINLTLGSDLHKPVNNQAAQIIVISFTALSETTNTTINVIKAEASAVERNGNVLDSAGEFNLVIVPKTLSLEGDLDHNEKVDIFDYNILLENFGKTDCGNVADITGPDANGNCKVDIFDYNILLENFGKTI